MERRARMLRRWLRPRRVRAPADDCRHRHRVIVFDLNTDGGQRIDLVVCARAEATVIRCSAAVELHNGDLRDELDYSSCPRATASCCHPLAPARSAVWCSRFLRSRLGSHPIRRQRPSEVTGDNLLVEPVGQLADAGHPPGYYRTCSRCLPRLPCTWYSCRRHARRAGGSSLDWIQWHPPWDDTISAIGSDGSRTGAEPKPAVSETLDAKTLRICGGTRTS